MIPKLKQFAQGYLIGHRFQADIQFIELKSVQWDSWREGMFAECSCWALQVQVLTAMAWRGKPAITTTLYHHIPKRRKELIAQGWTVQS